MAAPSRQPRSADQARGYVGLITRVIAFVIDASLIQLIALIVSVGAALIISVIYLPSEVKTVLAAVGGFVYIAWTIGYFVAFWSMAGQTPGDRVMRCRVITVDGEPLKPRRALLRCFYLALAAIPLFAGLLIIPFDSRRRGFHDRLARTFVVDAPALSLAEQRRAQRRGEPAAQLRS